MYVRRIVPVIIAVMAVAFNGACVYAATYYMGSSSLFLHSSYKSCNIVDPVTKNRIVMPAKYSNTFISPAMTGAPELKGKETSFSASGCMTNMAAVNRVWTKDLGKTYPSYTDAKYYVYDLDAAYRKGTTNEFWVKNIALYNPELRRDNNPSKWELYDLRISIKPVLNNNYYLNTSKTRSGKFLLIEKSVVPNIAIYGPAQVVLNYDYYEAGTTRIKTPSTYATYDDIDYGQGLWLKDGIASPNGMNGPTYVAVTTDTNLSYKVFASNNREISQVNSALHEDIIQDAVGIYYSSSSFRLGFSSNYVNSKYTGALAGFQSNRRSMTDREPNTPFAWVETEGDRSYRCEAALKTYDETAYLNLQHVVADGYQTGNYFSKYVMRFRLPACIDGASAIKEAKVVSGYGADATTMFNIRMDGEYVLAEATAAALQSESFYGKTYTLSVPINVKDVSGVTSRDAIAKRLGIEVGDNGAFSMEASGDISISTRTGLSYDGLSSDSIRINGRLPIVTAGLRSPEGVSSGGSVSVRGEVDVTDHSSDAVKVKEIYLYIGNENGEELTPVKPSEISASDTEDSLEYIAAERLTVEDDYTSDNRTCVCMKYITEWSYRGKKNEFTEVITHPILIKSFTSRGEDGIRYINENVRISHSRWESGELNEELENTLRLKNPKQTISLNEVS